MQAGEGLPDAVAGVVLDRDAGREGLGAGAAQHQHLEVGVCLQAGEGGVELGDGREVEDVERRPVEGESRRPAVAGEVDGRADGGGGGGGGGMGAHASTSTSRLAEWPADGPAD